MRWLMVVGIVSTWTFWGDRSPARAQDASDVTKVIAPFVEKHCVHCHGEKKPKGDVSLHAFKDEASILN